MEIHPTKLGSEQIFREHRFLWWLNGFARNKDYKYYVYSFAVNTIFTFWYPVHLVWGTINAKTSQELFNGLSIVLTAGISIVQTLLIIWHIRQVGEINQLIAKLDARVHLDEERNYYNENMYRPARNVAYLFYGVCIGCSVFSEMSTIALGLIDEWRLMYPGYFPFDIHHSTTNFIAAHLYQIIGVSWLIGQNFINDTYLSMTMALLAGHVHLLGERVARIGHDPEKSLESNESELRLCILDHLYIMQYHATLTEIVSLCMFCQITCTGLNLCFTIAYIVFYVKNFWSIIYYLFYLVSLSMELFPTCFYGTFLDDEFEKFTQVIFSSNWMDQSKKFKQDFRILCERSLSPMHINAGNVIPVNLKTFLATCKTTYSLFTLVAQMN